MTLIIKYIFQIEQSNFKGDKVDPMNTKKILLAACDNLREDLKLKGIQLKVLNFPQRNFFNKIHKKLF
jgi:hypothetical protein